MTAGRDLDAHTRDDWEFRLDASGVPRRTRSAQADRRLDEGEIRLRLLVGGVCGSDLGTIADLAPEAREGSVAPLHEIVAEVIDSTVDRLAVGTTVVGTGATGLAATAVESSDFFIPAPPKLSTVESVTVQPVATVIRAVDTLPPLQGRRVVVLGAGSIGLAFVHVLRRRGVADLTAVDRVGGRADLAHAFGADHFVAATAQAWSVDAARGGGRPELVIDAVGREPGIIAGALRAVADGGYVLGFGGARPGDYPIPFEEMYHRRLTLASGRTRDGWVDVLETGAEYVLAHRADFARYVTHRVDVDEAASAYEMLGRPDPSRIKVAVVAPS